MFLFISLFNFLLLLLTLTSVPKLIALKGTLPVVDSMFILMNSSEESYAKGQATFQRGAIASLILNGREILAEVEGGGTYGRGRLHKVNLSLTKPKSLLPPNNNEDDGEEERAMMKKIVMVKRAVCSCSYDREGWCKHIVATLLCLLHKQNAETTPTRRRQVQQSSIREFAADKTSPSKSSTTKKRKNDEGDDDKEEGDDDRTQTETRHKRPKRRQPDQTQMRGKQKRTEVIPRKYIPRYRSGAWALLQALIRAEQEEIVRNYPGYLSKKQLLDLAGPYCDSSFYAESTGFGSGQNFYTAWNSMATLIGKGLVQKKGAPAKYSLTESGRQLAQSLLAAEQEETTNNPSSKWQQNDDEDEENDDDENETERTKQKTEKEMKNKVLLKLDDTSSSSDDESAVTKNKAKEDDEADQNEKQDKDPTWIGSGSTVNDDTIMMMEEPIVWAPSASTTVFIAEPNPYSPQYRPEEGPEQKHLSPLLPGPSEELEKDNEPQESTSSRFDADVLAVHTTFATPASAASISLPFNFDIEGEQKVENGMTTYTTFLRAKTEECPNKKERNSSTCATTVIELSESDDEKHETDEKHGQTIEPRKHEEKKEELRTIKVENVLQVLSEEEEEKDNEENEDDMLSVGKDDRTNYTSSFSSSQSLFLDLTDIEPQTSPTKSFPDEFLPTSTSASQTSTKEKTKRFAQGSVISSTFSSKNKKQTNATTKHREKVITSFEIVLVLDNREIHEKPAYKTMFKRLRESGILCEARALALGDMLWIARIAYQTKLLHSHQRKNKDAKANEEEDEEDTEEDLELDQRWDETDSGEEEYVLGQIAERKTMADMLASIQDKRYQEQKFRLSQLCAANRVSTVLYILEGVNVAMNSDNSNSHKDVDALQMELLRDAIVETQTVDGFYVVRTDNERHTANYLRELTHHIESLYHRSKWAYRHSSSSSSSSCSSSAAAASAASRSSSGDEPASLFLWNNRSMLSYSRFNLLASKSGNLTLKHLFAKQLMQIPNCQAAKARAIVDSYSTPAALFEAYVAMEEEDKAREEREERREEERELTKNNREKEKRRKERRKEELLKDLRMEEEGEAGNSSHVHVAVGPATSKRVYHFYNDLT
ncbi:Crossover junction endonuclease mus81, variant 2 [Balamuthia mandrillaris]